MEIVICGQVREDLYADSFVVEITTEHGYPGNLHIDVVGGFDVKEDDMLLMDFLRVCRDMENAFPEGKNRRKRIIMFPGSKSGLITHVMRRRHFTALARKKRN